MGNFTQSIMERVRHEWDAIIIVSGERGVGKTTCMQTFGFEMDNKFDQSKNISYIPTEQDIIDRFNSLAAYQVLGIDEAMEIMYKQDFMKGFQKTLIKMYGRERKQFKITIMCIPAFADLTKTFRNTFVKYWIYIAERGHGVILCKPQTPYSDDAWNLKSLDKQFTEVIMKHKVTNISPQMIIDSLKKTPYFLEEFWFDDLPKDKKELYAKYHDQERAKFYAADKIDNVGKPKTFIENMVAYEKDVRHLSYVEIADIGQVYSDKQISRFHKAAHVRETLAQN